MRKILTLSALVLLSSTLAGCGVETYETSSVNATVIEKEHEKKKVTYKRVKTNGKYRMKRKVKPEEYEVDVKYKDIEKEFDGKHLYNKVKVGQKIKVTYTQGFNKDGELVYEDIELVE